MNHTEVCVTLNVLILRKGRQNGEFQLGSTGGMINGREKGNIGRAGERAAEPCRINRKGKGKERDETGRRVEMDRLFLAAQSWGSKTLQLEGQVMEKCTSDSSYATKSL